ncbi:hypothetical protein GCM10012275_31110 [Longimycelium tulufanense]|uniref:Alpha-L-arabinofuranosidase B arabinose-binding domain-containing protein n=1 Tax=Longimycelium tulufanense TaxID=907463 RepID=A0A8J3CF13_9PSEU|nr:AbfB domain-containing protein [Longimycelium tulufanense]GGM57683.1 hypothetical protein GCM10012275_31110 [Longimycelium tulufanense]
MAGQAEAVVPEASLEDKVRAASRLGIVAGDDLLVLDDRDFVFALWRQATGEEVRASAELALAGSPADCTMWIKVGIHEAVKRDQATEQRDAETARLARELKRNAAMVIGIEPTPEMLVLSYKDFVYQLWKQATGPKVKAAALEAFGQDETAQKKFLAEGIRKAHEQDQLDAIEQDKQASEAEKEHQKARAAKQRAMRQVLGVEPTEGMLELSDDNFIREVWNRATPDTEVHAAAVTALRSSDPAVWKHFIEAGIYQASDRDRANALKTQEEADRRRVLEIKARAEKSLVHPALVEAAEAALAAGPDAVSRFLRAGQYEALLQSVEVTTPGIRGWYVRNGADGPAHVSRGKDVPEDGAGADATWRIVPGLADSNCHSLEVADRPNVYLRQENLRVVVAPSDGSDQFRRDATWCSRPGLNGEGVSLESLSTNGRFLRHINAQLWAANDSGQNWFDNPHLFKEDATWQIRGANPVVTAIEYRWRNEEAIRVRLGNPTGAEQVDGDVRWRDFERGRMYWTRETGAHQMGGTVFEKYSKFGGHKSFLGLPTTDEMTTPDGIGRYNHFSRKDGASIYWSPSTGAHAVWGGIRAKWAELGSEKGLGYPTTDETGTADGVGRYNHFNGRGGASIYYSPSTGIHAVWGDIRAKWAELGSEKGLGYPTTDETGTADGVGRYNDFSKDASIYWSPSTGAHVIRGAIRSEWEKNAGEIRLGYPTTDETATPDGIGRYNHFSKNASVYWSPSTGAHAVSGGIRDKWASMGWERSSLGYPVSRVTVKGILPGKGTITYQEFQNGSIEHNSATGETIVKLK